VKFTVPSTSFRAVFTTSTSGWVRADYAWTPARHKCCDLARGITPTESLFMRYQSCRLLSAQHSTSALSLTAGCQWPTWRQSVAQHTVTHLRQIRHTLQSLSRVATKTLVHAFISSRLDYCNSVLYGVTDNFLQRLQSVQNAAARLITGRIAVNTSHLFCRNCTGCLSDAVWISNSQHWCLSRYTAAHRRISQTRASRRLRPVAVSARLAPSHASYRGPEIVWATCRLMSPDCGFGTSCLLHCGHLTVSANSEDSWKSFCLS